MRMAANNYHHNHASGSNRWPNPNGQYRMRAPAPIRRESFSAMTSAISLSRPKPGDITMTNNLQATLDSFGLQENEAELNHRMEVLARLNTMVKEWIVECSLARNMPKEVAEGVGGKVYTFGSYRLGVHHKGADLDALCVAPRHIDRTDYFNSFYMKLKACPDVRDLRAVEEAFVPVLKMNFDGIDIDLLFARLALKEIPEVLDLQDDMLLKNLDLKCVRSLNGCRVTDDILKLVPNKDTFRLALRAIKLWAKQHGVYSNVLGYLGGVSWAMLVARTCQLYPNAIAATIVHKFFLVFSQWKWPQPVLLRPPNYPNLPFPVWDPRTNQADRSHMMPIITPAFPQQNSTFNVSYSTRAIMESEFKVGFQLTDEIMMGRAQWGVLFEKPNFFLRYRHFIILKATSSCKSEHLEWYGLVESKIRQLILILEKNRHIHLVHTNPEVFKNRDYYRRRKRNLLMGIPEENMDNEEQVSIWFIGIEFVKVDALDINLTYETQNFMTSVMKAATNTAIYRDTMRIEAKYVRKKQLTEYLPREIIKRDRPAEDILASLAGEGTSLSASKDSDDEIQDSSSPPSASSVVQNKKANIVLKRKSDPMSLDNSKMRRQSEASEVESEMENKESLSDESPHKEQEEGSGDAIQDLLDEPIIDLDEEPNEDDETGDARELSMVVLEDDEEEEEGELQEQSPPQPAVDQEVKFVINRRKKNREQYKEERRRGKERRRRKARMNEGNSSADLSTIDLTDDHEYDVFMAKEGMLQDSVIIL